MESCYLMTVWEDDKALEMYSNNGMHNSVKIFNTTELHTYTWL